MIRKELDKNPQRQGARPHHPVPGRHRGRAAGLPLLGQPAFSGAAPCLPGAAPCFPPWRLPPFSFLHPAGQGPSCPASLSREIPPCRNPHRLPPRRPAARPSVLPRPPRPVPLPFPGRSARAAFRPALAGIAGSGAPVSPAAQGAACACAPACWNFPMSAAATAAIAACATRTGVCPATACRRRSCCGPRHRPWPPGWTRWCCNRARWPATLSGWRRWCAGLEERFGLPVTLSVGEQPREWCRPVGGRPAGPTASCSSTRPPMPVSMPPCIPAIV